MVLSRRDKPALALKRTLYTITVWCAALRTQMQYVNECSTLETQKM